MEVMHGLVVGVSILVHQDSPQFELYDTWSLLPVSPFF